MEHIWLEDMTLRPQQEPEVNALPDGCIEIAWERETPEGKSSITLLLRPDDFNKIIDRGRELRVLGKVTTTDAG